MANEDRIQSEFNSALQQLDRINIYLAMIAEARFMKRDYDWVNALDLLFSELEPYMKDAEKAPKWQELDEMMNLICMRRSNRPVSNSIDRATFQKLRTLESYLREIAHKAGLITKVKPDIGGTFI